MTTRLAALFACIVLLVGCGHSVTTTATSSADPDPAVGPVKPAEIGSLPLTLDQIKALGAQYLEEQSVETAPSDGPPENMATACGRASDTRSLNGWASYNLVRSTAVGNRSVNQELAVYHSKKEATEVFSRIQSDAVECQNTEQHDQFVNEPNKLSWSSGLLEKDKQFHGNMTSHDVRLAQNMIVETFSMRIDDGAALIGKVADQIVAKVNSVD